jgi:hypothetical protein
MIKRDLALGLFGRAHVVAATIVADGMLQCKTSEGRMMRGYQVHLLKKNPLLPVSCKIMHSAPMGTVGEAQNKSAGVMCDAGGFCLK